MRVTRVLLGLAVLAVLVDSEVVRAALVVGVLIVGSAEHIASAIRDGKPESK